MTQINILVMPDRARVLADTLHYRVDGDAGDIRRKTREVAGGVVVGRGNDTIIHHIADYLQECKSFDEAGEAFEDARAYAYDQQLERMYDEGDFVLRGLTIGDLDRVVRENVERHELRHWFGYEVYMVGATSGGLVMVGSSYEHDREFAWTPPLWHGMQVGLRTEFTPPSLDEQVADMRACYKADVAWCKANSTYKRPIAGGGDITLSEITPDGTVTHRTLGPLVEAPARREAKVGRNDPCPCGSGRKFKKCCLGNTEAAA